MIILSSIITVLIVSLATTICSAAVIWGDCTQIALPRLLLDSFVNFCWVRGQSFLESVPNGPKCRSKMNEYRGLSNYLLCVLGVPYFSDSILYPKPCSTY